MSKTTKKLGNPKYTLTLSTDAVVTTPSPALKRQWDRLDKFARQEFSKPYDGLSDVQKTQIHFNLNTGVYKEQEKKERAASKL